MDGKVSLYRKSVVLRELMNVTIITRVIAACHGASLALGDWRTWEALQNHSTTPALVQQSPWVQQKSSVIG